MDQTKVQVEAWVTKSIPNFCQHSRRSPGDKSIHDCFKPSVWRVESSVKVSGCIPSLPTLVFLNIKIWRYLLVVAAEVGNCYKLWNSARAPLLWNIWLDRIDWSISLIWVFFTILNYRIGYDISPRFISVKYSKRCHCFMWNTTII